MPLRKASAAALPASTGQRKEPVDGDDAGFWLGPTLLDQVNWEHPVMQEEIFGPVLVAMSFSGWIATLAGWYVTEIGRQPYLVTGVLKTADAVTSVASSNVGISLSIYLTLYVVLLIAYIRTLFVMARKSVLVDRPDEMPTLQ